MTRSEVPSGRDVAQADADEGVRPVGGELAGPLPACRGSRAARPSGSGVVARGERPSSRRWSGRQVGRATVRAPRSRVEAAELDAAQRSAPTGRRAAERGAVRRGRGFARLASRAARAATATPPRPPRRRLGRRAGSRITQSCSQTVSIGSRSMPLSTPFSQRSHQRTCSCRIPIGGPGTPRTGSLWPHGPMRPFRGTGKPFEQAQHGVRVPVRPAADGVHGAADRRVVLADRAVLPVGVAALVGEPGLDERRRPLEAVEPRARASVPDEPWVGRHRVEGEHAGRPVQHVHREHAAAAVVDVVRVAVVRGEEAHDRLQRRRLPRGELQAREPAPRVAGHRRRSRRTTAARRSTRSPRRRRAAPARVYSSSDDPVGVARSADVDPHARVAVAGEVAHLLVVADRGAVVLAVREVAEHGRNGAGADRAARASRRAAFRRRAAIHSCSTTRTSDGKSVRMWTRHGGSLADPAACQETEAAVRRRCARRAVALQDLGHRHHAVPSWKFSTRRAARVPSPRCRSACAR